jgi:anti-sigma B factor antagonist
MTTATPNPFLAVHIEQTAQASIVRVSGELDLATAPQLRDALAGLSRPPALVILDLEHLTFADSTGLREMLVEHRRAARGGYDFVIAAASEPVRRLFQLTALDMTLNLVDDIASAIGAHSSE